MAYVHQEYPKVKYHPTEEPKTVKNKEEEKALGRGWQNRPCAAQKPVDEDSQVQEPQDGGDGEAKQPKGVLQRARGMLSTSKAEK